MRTTQRIRVDEIQKAADLIRAGGVVAFPTETVYGLGADALNPTAVDKIFLAKGRPSDNPLIAHVSSTEQLESISENLTPIARLLIERFWPGPLTIVVEKKKHIPDAVTAKLGTVAVRMPNDPVAIELIRRVGSPVVAPSANRSGRPSATTWQAVLEDLDGRIDGVVCGPQTQIGLESTVVDTTTAKPIILRHGAITQEMIAQACGNIALAESHLLSRSPGTRHRHYQPTAQIILVDQLDHIEPDQTPIGILGHGQDGHLGHLEEKLKKIFPKGKIKLCDSLNLYAHSLFDFFRECDALGIHTIYCQTVERQGIGSAIMDRLDRASHRS